MVYILCDGLAISHSFVFGDSILTFCKHTWCHTDQNQTFQIFCSNTLSSQFECARNMTVLHDGLCSHCSPNYSRKIKLSTTFMSLFKSDSLFVFLKLIEIQRPEFVAVKKRTKHVPNPVACYLLRVAPSTIAEGVWLLDCLCWMLELYDHPWF
jgi:hypothetical protein